LVAQHGPALPWVVLKEGFEYRGQKLLFANRARGIFKPATMPGNAPLSVKTTVPKSGRTARYEDLAADDGFIYRFQGEDPNATDNRRLLDAQQRAVPLIYFYGLEPSVYQPIWPVYVSNFDPFALSCRLVADEAETLLQPGTFVADPNMQALQRRYVTVLAKRRLHQQAFRLQVLHAYADRCAICRFPRRELLEAAHIVPDHSVRGEPEVPNGLALCRLHHGAFDTDFLGIRPDGVIEIAPALLAERDGPTLEHGIKGFHGKVLHMPDRTEARPKQIYLEERYEQFRTALGR
jgi:putative restriction endonuclease